MHADRERDIHEEEERDTHAKPDREPAEFIVEVMLPGLLLCFTTQLVSESKVLVSRILDHLSHIIEGGE